MSRSVSAPSSVTKTSPCWKGLIVPGSTFRYGSNFCTCTLSPRAFRSRPSDAAVMPLAGGDGEPARPRGFGGLEPQLGVDALACQVEREERGRLDAADEQQALRAGP